MIFDRTATQAGMLLRFTTESRRSLLMLTLFHLGWLGGHPVLGQRVPLPASQNSSSSLPTEATPPKALPAPAPTYIGPEEVQESIRRDNGASSSRRAQSSDSGHTPELEAEQLDTSGAEYSALKRFGESFFSRSRDEFTKSEDALVPDNYSLAPGDQITALTYNVHGGETPLDLTLDQRGDVYLPGAGEMHLAGLSKSAAQSSMSARVQQQFPSMRVKITGLKIRKIRIFVVGESNNPGSHLVNADSTLMDALLVSGGPNLNGSYRSIRLERAGSTVAVVDLYDLFLKGNSTTPRVRDGDRLFIPQAGPLVAVSGEVRRRAIFELRGKTTLAEVIRWSGGLTPQAYAANIQIQRVKANRSRSVETHTLSQAGRSFVQGGDFVKVFPVLQQVVNGVYVEGQVRQPGLYPLRKNERVAELIKDALGLKEESFSDQAEIYRITGPDEPAQIIGVDLRRAIEKDPIQNVLLQPRDRLVVHQRSEAMFDKRVVRVQGEVSRPADYPRYENMRVRDLLTAAGGLTPEADVHAELVRQSSEGRLVIIPLELNRILADNNSDSNVLVQDLDAILVKRQMRARRWPSTVTLGGEVKRPGVYGVDPERDSLADVVARAGGLTEFASPRGAIFVRQAANLVEPLQQQFSTQIFQTLQLIAQEYTLAQASLQQTSQTSLSSAPVAVQSAAMSGLSLTGPEAIVKPREIDRILTTGRIPIDLQAVVSHTGDDPGVKDGDRLYVPTNPRVVIVSGAVVAPSAIIYHSGNVTSDYVLLAGGFAKDAARDDTVVIRANGEVVRVDAADIVLPGDIILVPPDAIIAEPNLFDRFLRTVQAGVSGIALWRLLSP